MINMKNITKILILVVIIWATSANSLFAERFKGEEKVFSPKAEANCNPSVASNELSIGNVRAYIQTNGTMWNKEVALYEIPKGSGQTSLFAAALWIGGKDASSQLKLAAVRFNQSGEDFWTGPLSTVDATIPKSECAKWDKHFKITRQEVEDFISYYENNKTPPYENYTVPKSILDWPAHPMDWKPGQGPTPYGQSPFLAPFRDRNNDGIYSPEDGDYPFYDIDADGWKANTLCPWTPENRRKAMEGTLESPPEDRNGKMHMVYSDHVLKGDETLFWIFNDKGNAHTESKGMPIGLEIRGQAFAFATNDELNNMTFYSYEIINRSTFELRETYFSQWVDADLGFSHDDYVGCDVLRGLGYCYNAQAIDGTGQAWAYGENPPAVGVDFFQGPYLDPDGYDNPSFNKKQDDNVFGPSFNANYTNPCDIVTLEGAMGTFTWDRNGEADMISGQALIRSEAINGVNFGDGIVDNERYGMRRFVYHSNIPDPNSPTTDPSKAEDYYNYLTGIWRDNQRMKYGGNGHPLNGGTGPECDFMFPGTTDPCNWGTKGTPHGISFSDARGWVEENVPNPTNEDRRFMQSAGPFTLKAGTVNYITVGIPWARTTSGGPWASVELLKVADDKCQSLFENCFTVLDGPDAPDLTIIEQENQLILLVDNVNNNNVNESYEGFDNQITGAHADGTPYDQYYRFEGYIIYQLKNESVSVTDLDNLNLARVVAQCDIENYRSNGKPIDQLVNVVYDEKLGFGVPKEMVHGNNKGIQHSFSIVEDAFALGDKKLVNHKTYYYMVLAYAYNEYLKYDVNPNNPEGLKGQQRPFLAGRKNIHAYRGVPHKSQPHFSGTEIRCAYGTQPEISRIEGQGNGGIFLDLKDECLAEILQKGKASQLDYKINAGPVSVKVIDPLKVKPYNYTIKIMDSAYFRNPNTADITDSSYWLLSIDDELTKDELKALGFDSSGTIRSHRPISVLSEQLLMELGISVTLLNANFKIHQEEVVDYIMNRATYKGLNWVNYTKYGQVDFVGSEIQFTDPARPWLGGVPDSDLDFPNNWIRAGSNNTGIWESNSVQEGADNDYSKWRTEDFFNLYTDQPAGASGPTKIRAYKDYKGQFEKAVSGTWSPYVLSSPYTGGPQAKYITPDTLLFGGKDQSKSPTPSYSEFQNISALFRIPGHNMTMTNLYSVDIVMTNDKSKWTRCVVLEACDDSRYSVNQIDNTGNPLKNEPRKSKSVDKNGKTSDSNDPSDDPNHPNFISAYGMGWFPGYAINVETGERLNIMFSENSSDVKNNGRDMIFNPTETYAYLYRRDVITGVVDTTVVNMETYNYWYERLQGFGNADFSISKTPVWGGKHYVYVCGSSGNTSSYYYLTNNTTNPDLIHSRNFNDRGKTRNSNGQLHGGSLNGYPYYECTSYDHGRWLLNKFNSFVGQPSTSFLTQQLKMQLFNNVMWTSIPMPTNRRSGEWLSNDVKIKLRVTRPYMRYHSRWYDAETDAPYEETLQNHGFPMYKFSTKNIAPVTNNKEVHADLLNEINIVPNPYYGFSTYERTSLETYVKMVNLPDYCDISIFTVNGTLVKKFKKASSGISYVDWDLKNDAGIPISGGIYIIYIRADGIGERTLKFLCAMRPTDLNAF
jgi:hypothetical protein